MKFKLIEHNSNIQMNYSGHDDTRRFLKVGEIYEGWKQVYDWHTDIIISGRKFNSVCFEEIDGNKITDNYTTSFLKNIIEYYFGIKNNGMYPAEMGEFRNQVSMDEAIRVIKGFLRDNMPEALLTADATYMNAYNRALEDVKKALDLK